MHHLQLNKTALQKRRGVTSISSCIVLDGWDSAKSKHWFSLLSSWDPSWVSLKRHGAISKIWFQYPNYLHFTWLDAICFSSATGILYGLSARGWWHWHCLRKDNNSFDLLNCMYFEKVCFWLLRTACNVSNDFHSHAFQLSPGLPRILWQKSEWHGFKKRLWSDCQDMRGATGYMWATHEEMMRWFCEISSY